MSKELMTIESGAGVPTIESYAQNLEQKLKMCRLLRESGFVPASFKTDGAVLAAILYGQELSFSPMQSLQSIDIIQGKPVVNAQGLKAKILAAGGVIKELEWTDKVCTLEGTRAGNKQTASFTMEDARLQGLIGKDNWKRMPKAMLYARASSMLARNQWADVIKGVYGAEEMQDAAEVEPRLASVTNLRTADEVLAADLSCDSKGQSGMEATQVIKVPKAATEHDHTELLGFGKHAQQTWETVNQQYLEWLVGRHDPKLSPRAMAEIERRANIDAIPVQWENDDLPVELMEGE